MQLEKKMSQNKEYLSKQLIENDNIQKLIQSLYYVKLNQTKIYKTSCKNKWLKACIFILIILTLPTTILSQNQNNLNQIKVDAEIPKKIEKKQQQLNFIPAQIVVPNDINKDQNLNNQIAAQQILQVQKQSQITQQKKDQLEPWIKQQMEQMDIQLDLPITQTFQFIINQGQQLIYKWNPSKNKQLKIVVNVFSIGRLGDLQVMRSSEQNQYIQVSTKNPNKAIFTYLGKVYSSKVIPVDFDTDFKYLKFLNKNDQRALISIDIQKLEFVVQEGIKDQLLSKSNNKMNMMLQKAKTSQIKQQHMYKWQWGYLQNEQLHQMKILGFSGIELFTIIVTALVQMYSIKSLLDNRAVV